MKKNEEKLDVVFVIDKSGSMSGSEENTISSFNEYIEREYNNSYNTNVTTILFSDNYKYLYRRKNIRTIKKMTNDDYIVGGCTALYDTLGNCINYIDECETNKVMFIIITDGYENASKKFNSFKIRNMIKKHKNWEFIYIGADIDSYATGGSIGIKKENIANYKKDTKGTNLLFKSISKFQDCMMGDCSCDISWKEELENYLEDNIE